MQLINPTPDIVSTYNSRFEAEGYGLTARAIRKLFQVFPKNDQLEEVLLKVTAVNGL